MSIGEPTKIENLWMWIATFCLAASWGIIGVLYNMYQPGDFDRANHALFVFGAWQGLGASMLSIVGVMKRPNLLARLLPTGVFAIGAWSFRNVWKAYVYGLPFDAAAPIYFWSLVFLGFAALGMFSLIRALDRANDAVNFANTLPLPPLPRRSGVDK